MHYAKFMGNCKGLMRGWPTVRKFVLTAPFT